MAQGDLSRQEMEAIIARGESVFYKGRQIVSVDGLPSEAELADGDEERENLARENLQNQIRSLQDQLSRLDTRQRSRTASTRESDKEPKDSPARDMEEVLAESDDRQAELREQGATPVGAVPVETEPVGRTVRTDTGSRTGDAATTATQSTGKGKKD